MIKVYADQIKDKKFIYIEDVYSSYEIITTDMDDFKKMISSFIHRYGDVHTCYDTFINHIGTFVRDYGKAWYGEEFVVVTHKYLGRTDNNNKVYTNDEHEFNEKGQIKNWPFEYFG